MYGFRSEFVPVMLPEIKVLLSIKKSFHLPAAWCMVSTPSKLCRGSLSMQRVFR
jgi:hypothetical protein